VKQGVPRVVIDAKNTSNECPKCNHRGLEKNSYRRLRCLELGFGGDRNVIAKLNIRRRALKILELPREL
jgi:Putative transposase DNA-binding domain.